MFNETNLKSIQTDLYYLSEMDIINCKFLELIDLQIVGDDLQSLDIKILVFI